MEGERIDNCCDSINWIFDYWRCLMNKASIHLISTTFSTTYSYSEALIKLLFYALKVIKLIVDS